MRELERERERGGAIEIERETKNPYYGNNKLHYVRR